MSLMMLSQHGPQLLVLGVDMPSAKADRDTGRVPVVPMMMAGIRQAAREQAIRALAIDGEDEEGDFEKLRERAQSKGWQLTRTEAGNFLMRKGSYSIHTGDLGTVSTRLKS